MNNSESVIVSRWPAPFIETIGEQGSRSALYCMRLHVGNQEFTACFGGRHVRHRVGGISRRLALG